MKRELLQVLCCPGCGGSLELSESFEVGGEVERRRLSCALCRFTYPVVDSVPRFGNNQNYAANFGLQWNHFRQTQLDSHTGRPISRNRLLRQTGWPPEQFVGKTVLDVGCGTGRFAEVALSCGATVIAVDYSSAVDACWKNLGGHPRLSVVQADIYALPFRPGCFDLVYCLGVLQHTPDVRKAFSALPPLLAEGGTLVVDCYVQSFRSLCHPRYLLRPLTKRMRPERLFPLVERAVPALLRVSRTVGRLPALGSYLKRLVPVANYEGVYPLSDKQLEEWATLDTYDWLSPQYDRPQRGETLQEWFRAAGLVEVEVFLADHLTGRGRRSQASHIEA